MAGKKTGEPYAAQNTEPYRVWLARRRPPRERSTPEVIESIREHFRLLEQTRIGDEDNFSLKTAA